MVERTPYAHSMSNSTCKALKMFATFGSESAKKLTFKLFAMCSNVASSGYWLSSL